MKTRVDVKLALKQGVHMGWCFKTLFSDCRSQHVPEALERIAWITECLFALDDALMTDITYARTERPEGVSS